MTCEILFISDDLHLLKAGDTYHVICLKDVPVLIEDGRGKVTASGPFRPAIEVGYGPNHVPIHRVDVSGKPCNEIIKHTVTR